MWGAAIPQIYYGFWESPQVCKFYWTTVGTHSLRHLIAILILLDWNQSTLLCLGSGYVTIHPRFRTPAYRSRRTIMYVALGLSALIYVLHGIILHGWHAQYLSMSLDWELVTLLVFVFGASTYALRVSLPQLWGDLTDRLFQIPERWYPVRFDVWGASHQVFHFMVLCGGLTHTVALVKACAHVHSVSAR